MVEPIPLKGAVLTQTSAWWFRQFDGLVKHHMISADAEEIIAQVPALRGHARRFAGRTMLCKRGTVFPIECVIRGYLSGSAVARICQERHARRRGACRRGCRKRPARPADLQSGDQGRERA
jgi:phosphoribosylaminoimidazole-succinocarboxamide synthase